MFHNVSQCFTILFYSNYISCTENNREKYQVLIPIPNHGTKQLYNINSKSMVSCITTACSSERGLSTQLHSVTT
jgi:hypothetical protein